MRSGLFWPSRVVTVSLRLLEGQTFDHQVTFLVRNNTLDIQFPQQQRAVSHS